MNNVRNTSVKGVPRYWFFFFLFFCGIYFNTQWFWAVCFCIGTDNAQKNLGNSFQCLDCGSVCTDCLLSMQVYSVALCKVNPFPLNPVFYTRHVRIRKAKESSCFNEKYLTFISIFFIFLWTTPFGLVVSSGGGLPLFT